MNALSIAGTSDWWTGYDSRRHLCKRMCRLTHTYLGKTLLDCEGVLKTTVLWRANVVVGAFGAVILFESSLFSAVRVVFRAPKFFRQVVVFERRSVGFEVPARKQTFVMLIAYDWTVAAYVADAYV